MQKRGQVSVFIIIGIVALAAIIFVFLLIRGFQEKAREITDPKEYLESQINDIRRVVTRCIGDESREALNLLFLGGGHIDPPRYTNYYGNHVVFLCYKVEDDEPCYNMMFTEDDIAKELMPVLERNIFGCIQEGIAPFQNKEDYTLSTGDFGLDFLFDERALLVTVDYPMTLTKGNITETQERFSKETITNFWKVARMASDVINKEAKGENVDVPLISSTNIYVELGRTTVLGGNLYVISSRYNPGEDPPFYFGVET